MKHIEIEGKQYQVVKEFPVLYQGWECDDIGYVVKKGKKLFLAMSSHGFWYIANQQEVELKIKEYKEAAKESQDALQLIYKERK